MWYASRMPEILPKEEVDAAYAAVDAAKAVRQFHRRRTERGNKQREADISLALERLKTVMQPLRSEIGRFPYGPQTDTADKNRLTIYDASKAVQRERRKLWKMKNPKG
jgi:hypothetical protein